MTNILRSKFHLLIGLTGTAVFCLGFFILASGIVVKNLLNGLETFSHLGRNGACEYWGGLPTILTGSILTLAVILNKHRFLKYISLCAVLITMVLTLGVIMEELLFAATVYQYSREDSFACRKIPRVDWIEREEDCLKLKKAVPWYYIMLFAANIVFVLCSFVALILFIDWILFVALRTPHNNFEMVYQLSPGSQRGYSDLQSQTLSDP
ncbi:uncharacterized protein LOC114521724 isoform X1 [Dendronephthya gigantea]|uniref:uncharacterized protein LOC114521724 isoform X1 n=1 Tax=Dendronephthya gigantea TaxID=151771 RepID=UPI00106A81E6|nr:uncharacterized protein LOC114521724 isoform X1 [Dendronephthya gigantea]